MLEYIFRLYKNKVIDSELWLRWEATVESTMTIPKFKKVWFKTKASRSGEFRDSLIHFHCGKYVLAIDLIIYLLSFSRLKMFDIFYLSRFLLI